MQFSLQELSRLDQPWLAGLRVQSRAADTISAGRASAQNGTGRNTALLEQPSAEKEDSLKGKKKCFRAVNKFCVKDLNNEGYVCCRTVMKCTMQ